MDHQMWYQTSSVRKKGHHRINQEYKARYLTLLRANLAQLQANLKVKQWMSWMLWLKQIQNQLQRRKLPHQSSSHRRRRKIPMKRTNSLMAKRKLAKRSNDLTFQSTQWLMVRVALMRWRVAPKLRLRQPPSKRPKWWISKTKKSPQIQLNLFIRCRKWNLTRNHKLLWASSIL